jgi:hypothetical protein
MRTTIALALLLVACGDEPTKLAEDVCGACVVRLNSPQCGVAPGYWETARYRCPVRWEPVAPAEGDECVFESEAETCPDWARVSLRDIMLTEEEGE